VTDRREEKARVEWGPCCFCGKPIESAPPGACRVTVETAEAKWQVWSCRSRCFRSLWTDDPMLEPAHF
jgi:hypothetical protein